MSLEIEWARERLILLAGKAIAWPRTATLIVADLHLGKAASFRMSGIPVPEATTRADLARLDAMLSASRSERLIVLGDFFHSALGRQPDMMDAVADWCRTNAALEIVLVPGNHDAKSGEPPASWNINSVADGWPHAPFSFCHVPRDVPGGHVLAGHIHPSICLRENYGRGLRAPCFWFGKTRAVLPAFGSFTGTSAIRAARGDRIFAIGEGEVIDLTATR